jgi:molecular chaperone IbpA
MHIQPYSNDPWDKHKRKNPWDIGTTPDEDKHKKWQMETKKIVTIADLFPRLDRLSIGWSPILDQLKEITNNKPTYPPYDIIQLDDETNLLNVAVAGFSKKEISVTVKDSTIIIQGNKDSKEKGEVLYQGIATRDFTLSLAIAEYWVVSGATLDNGLLVITFKKELPEEKKSKVIDIK